MCQSKQYFLGQISKPVNLFKPRFNFQPFGSSGKGKRAHKMAGNQLENEPNSNPTGIKNIERNYFFFPWAVFKVTKKWRWWQVKSNALFLHTLVPSPRGNSSFGSYFPFKNLAFGIRFRNSRRNWTVLYFFRKKWTANDEKSRVKYTIWTEWNKRGMNSPLQAA